VEPGHRAQEEAGDLGRPVGGDVEVLPGVGQVVGDVGEALGDLLKPETVLDLEPGFDGVPILKERVNAVRAAFPRVQPLTEERLAQLPSRSNTCTQAVFATYRMPDGPAPASIWLLEDYLAEDDIVEGVLIIRPEHGGSEHGSVFGKDLIRMGGEVLNFTPMSLREALGLCSVDHEQALARVRGA
jgi:hypothetical protein